MQFSGWATKLSFLLPFYEAKADLLQCIKMHIHYTKNLIMKASNINGERSLLLESNMSVNNILKNSIV
jgi:hypothetical protein